MEVVCEYFGSTLQTRKKHPFGGYFETEIKGENVAIYFCGDGKARSAASCQHMMDKFDLEKVIVAGTCTGVDGKKAIFDIVISE